MLPFGNVVRPFNQSIAFPAAMCSIVPSKFNPCKNVINATLLGHWNTDGGVGFCFESRPNELRDQRICGVASAGLTRANRVWFYNRSRRIEFHGRALVRYGIYVCVREDQDIAGWDSPEITGHDTECVRVEENPEVNNTANDYVVVNFYHFVNIEDPQLEVAKHRSFLQGWDIHGRIYINEQGINAQYSGPSMDALAYADWVKEDSRFKDILVQATPSLGHAFPRLKLRYKSSLVQVEDGASHLPLLDPSMNAVPLTPSEWKKQLEVMKSLETELDEISSTKITSMDQRRNVLLLDVRNGFYCWREALCTWQWCQNEAVPVNLGYEWDVGHFYGAQRPHVDCFKSTTFGFSDTKTNFPDPLVGVNKETTNILMYCTGGIRCDVYSVILRQKGFQNLYTLKGGVAHYLKEEGPCNWIGNLFVFDSRLSVSPVTYKHMGATEKGTRGKGACHGDNQRDESYVVSDKSAFGRCYVCSSHVFEMRHRNCANLDCNRLILSCQECVQRFKGCCSMACTCAPRLRPVLPSPQPYQRWHKYRDSGN